ncbi:MAG: sulfur carrier protein ThiS [Bacteroidales bacterium]|nr:sulfur carrier protein ThiS [Bacteroidales bacterium]
MKIIVNSKEQDTNAANVGELVAELGLADTKIAVAMDSKMIQKDAWATTPLVENCKIIIIKAVCGG